MYKIFNDLCFSRYLFYFIFFSILGGPPPYAGDPDPLMTLPSVWGWVGASTCLPDAFPCSCIPVCGKLGGTLDSVITHLASGKH